MIITIIQVGYIIVVIVVVIVVVAAAAVVVVVVVVITVVVMALVVVVIIVIVTGGLSGEGLRDACHLRGRMSKSDKQLPVEQSEAAVSQPQGCTEAQDGLSMHTSARALLGQP